MIAAPAGARILLATRPIDVCKGAHSLAALGADPSSGAVLVFRSRRVDRVTILLWDGSGLVLVWKQLEASAFCWPAIVDGVVRLTPVEFAALFDGIDWRRAQANRRRAGRGRLPAYLPRAGARGDGMYLLPGPAARDWRRRR